MNIRIERGLVWRISPSSHHWPLSSWSCLFLWLDFSLRDHKYLCFQVKLFFSMLDAQILNATWDPNFCSRTRGFYSTSHSISVRESWRLKTSWIQQILKKPAENLQKFAGESVDMYAPARNQSRFKLRNSDSCGRGQNFEYLIARQSQSFSGMAVTATKMCIMHSVCICNNARLLW